MSRRTAAIVCVVLLGAVVAGWYFLVRPPRGDAPPTTPAATGEPIPGAADTNFHVSLVAAAHLLAPIWNGAAASAEREYRARAADPAIAAAAARCDQLEEEIADLSVAYALRTGTIRPIPIGGDRGYELRSLDERFAKVREEADVLRRQSQILPLKTWVAQSGWARQLPGFAGWPSEPPRARLRELQRRRDRLTLLRDDWKANLAAVQK